MALKKAKKKKNSKWPLAAILDFGFPSKTIGGCISVLPMFTENFKTIGHLFIIR